jgi:iron complex outermembrane recepter protein
MRYLFLLLFLTYLRPAAQQTQSVRLLIADISTNAFELLEKTPGLFLDQDGNVYLTSATPATIYINGREQKMGASEIATLLRSLPPNSIERLEIMRTPSARYAARAGAGR